MDKVLSDKQFIRKAESARVSALGFLEAYEEHIRSSYPEATVAIDMFKSGQMLPNPALEFVKQVVGQHILKSMTNRAEESMQKQAKKEKKAPSKSGSTGQGKYTCQFFCKVVNERTGDSQEHLWVDHNGNDTFRAETYQAAMRLVDRKLSDISHGLYATISQEIREGKMLTTRVDRNDAVARFLGVKRGPVCKVKPTSAPLKQTMSVHNFVATFSRG